MPGLESGKLRPQIVRWDGFDPDELRSLVPGGRFDVCQLDHGRMQGEGVHVSDAFTAIRSSHSLGLQGRMPHDQSTILLLVDAPSSARVNGVSVRVGDVAVCGPGSHIHAHLPRSTTWLSMPESRPPASEDGSIRYYRPRWDLRAQALKQADRLITQAGTGVATSAAPLHSVVRAGVDSAHPLRGESLPSLRRRRRVLRQACEHMLSHLQQPVTVDELCEVTGASRRSLNHVFRESLGVGLMSYYRAQRFAAVRRVLLRPDGPKDSVTSIATRFGFMHLGRFSVEYRERFDERPSETLQSD